MPFFSSMFSRMFVLEGTKFEPGRGPAWMTRAADRIVILNDSSTARGGATYLAWTLAQHLARSGERVTFIAGDRGVPEIAAGIEIVALGGDRLLDAGIRTAALSGLYNRTAGGTYVAGSPSMTRRERSTICITGL